MSTQINVDVWQCDDCGNAAYLKKTIICQECGGEMVYVGKAWVDAEPLPRPSRWEVIKENIELWWKRNAGNPDDPDGLGVNLLHVIFWSILFAVFLAIIS